MATLARRVAGRTALPRQRSPPPPGKAPARPLATAAGAGGGVALSAQYLLQASQGAGGDPVVVMHGLLGNKLNWRSLFRAGPLGELDRDVLVADARNHGVSPHHPEMTYDAMVDDVLRLLDDEDIDRVVAVGHSMGGKTAMQLALRAPERVSRLVVCDIAPVAYSSEAGPSDRSDSTFLDVFAAMESVDLAGVKSRNEADAALSAAIPADGLRAFVLTNLKLDKGPSGKGRSFAWRCNLGVLRDSVADIMDFPATAETSPYPGPALFIGGAESSYIAAAHMETIRRLFPQSAVHHVAGAGHFVHVDQPGQVGEMVAEFMLR